MRIVVVLPAPLGPSRPTSSPLATWNEMRSSARTGPKYFVRFSTSIIANSWGSWVPFLSLRRQTAESLIYDQKLAFQGLSTAAGGGTIAGGGLAFARGRTAAGSKRQSNKEE